MTLHVDENNEKTKFQSLREEAFKNIYLSTATGTFPSSVIDSAKSTALGVIAAFTALKGKI